MLFCFEVLINSNFGLESYAYEVFSPISFSYIFSFSTFWTRNCSCHDNITHLLLLYSYDCYFLSDGNSWQPILEIWVYEVTLLLYYFFFLSFFSIYLVNYITIWSLPKHIRREVFLQKSKMNTYVVLKADLTPWFHFLLVHPHQNLIYHYLFSYLWD